MEINLQTIKRIKKGRIKVLAAVSGGLDSMCLLHALDMQKKELEIELFAVTVNHNLRGRESFLDAAFVEDYCGRNNIKCESVSVEVMSYMSEKGFNIESMARKLRYEAFYRVKENLGCDIIATAHHADDNAESILLNILRGAGNAGVCGIAENRDNIIIRPLINVTRKELEQYALERGIVYRTDATNYDTGYNRNYLRHEILPKLSERFPSAIENINAFAARARMDEDFINMLVPEAVAVKNNKGNMCAGVPLNYFDNHATGVRAAKKALAALGAFTDITARNYSGIISLKDRDNGAVILLKNGIKAVRSYESIIFTAGDNEVIKYELPFMQGVTKTPYGEIEVSYYGPGNPDIKCKDAGNLYVAINEKLKSAVWRNRRQGDIFTKFGGGTKKLNDYFTDIKLNREERDTIPLLVSEGEVLAVAGIEISEKMRVNPHEEYIRIKYTEDSM